jgi:hypothetical protein
MKMSCSQDYFHTRLVNWFRDLPSVPKISLVGLVLVALLVLLSPVVRVVAIIAFLISVVVLATLGIQRKPVRGWVVAAVCFLVLIPVSGGISGAIYGENDQQAGGPSPGTSPGANSSPSASPSSSPSASPSASPSSSPSAAALEPGDEVTITAQPWGGMENINYDGREVVGMVFEYQGQRIMVLADSLSLAGNQLSSISVDVELGMEVPTATVHGEYQGVVGSAGGRSYEAILADSIEYE